MNTFRRKTEQHNLMIKGWGSGAPALFLPQAAKGHLHASPNRIKCWAQKPHANYACGFCKGNVNFLLNQENKLNLS
jgi:hypothetical protein